MTQREVSQLFDHVFKCLMSLSDTAIISLINGLFGTSYPPDSKVSRPSTETIETSMHRSLADMVIVINGDSYLIETQIHNDLHMGVRIFQYIMNEGRKRGSSTEKHIIRLNLPKARVIYWESTPSTPDQETIIFTFPDGKEYRYEVPSFKFSEYPVKELEKRGLSLLLPFCVLKLRHKVKRTKKADERRKLAVRMEELLEELTGAVERGMKRGDLSESDLGNMLLFTKLLQEEIYKPYTEFKVEAKMWEHIKVIDFDSIWKERDKAKAQADEAKAQADEAKAQADKAKAQADKATRRAEAATRKLLELGVPREQLVKDGILAGELPLPAGSA
jgi:hypothetical protein